MSRFVRALPACLALLVGCGTSAEDRIVGIYSLDPVRTSVPEIPGMPGIDNRIREVTRNTRLKLLSDHTFVLTGVRVTEGTWRLEGETIRLKPKEGGAAGLLGGENGEITGRIGGERGAILIDRDTPVGKLSIHLRKTG
jgi:hypothetical protein